METLESIRHFKMYRGRLMEEKLSMAHKEQLVDAARWAPSGHNSQPWEFMFIDDSELIKRIAEIATANFDEFIARGSHLPRWMRNFSRWLRWSREELEDRGDGIYFKRWNKSDWEKIAGLEDEESIRTAAAAMFGSQGESNHLIRTAPCLLLTLINNERQVPDYSRDLLTLTSAGAAMQNIRLAASELGVAVHEQSLLYDLPETRKALADLLGLPAQIDIVGGMRLGYKAAQARSSFTNVRRPVAELMHCNSYT